MAVGPERSEGPKVLSEAKGFTLVELMVAVFVFSFVSAIATNFVVTSAHASRRALAQQVLLDQMSYTAEYMTRALRRAGKELNNPPGCLSARGLNYEVGANATSVAFVDDRGRCRSFFLADGAIQERVGSESGVALTASGVDITGLKFLARGEGQGDSLQPRITFAIRATSREDRGYEFLLQSTVSQRRYDASE